MAQREFDEPSTSSGYDESLETLDRRPDLSELFEGEVMGAGRRVIQEGRAREKLSHPDGRHPMPVAAIPGSTKHTGTTTEVADGD